MGIRAFLIRLCMVSARECQLNGIIEEMLGFTIILASVTVTNLLTSSIDTRLVSTHHESRLNRFVGYPNGADRDEFRPNTNFWAASVDLSCASPWNSMSGCLRAGTLVSKRHIVFARHYPLEKGTRILFVGMDGATCPCRIIRTAIVDNSDIMVGLLDYEVTPNVHPAKVLPVDYEKYIGRGGGLPVLTLNRLEKAFVADLMPFSTNATWRFICCHRTDNKLRNSFREPLVGGDSGNPAFLVAGSTPILIYCLTTGGHGGGYPIHKHRDGIQRVMNELCPGYQIVSYDFSAIEKK